MSHLPNVYAIIAIDAAAAVDYSQIGETSIDTIRMNLALTEFVIKWFDEHEPTFIADGTVVPLQTLTHAECIELMATPEWSEPMPVE
tara:strand:- start:53 stop:313 length:261 start_codon:yes stop_codon:yes gene_type:complete